MTTHDQALRLLGALSGEFDTLADGIGQALRLILSPAVVRPETGDLILFD